MRVDWSVVCPLIGSLTEDQCFNYTRQVWLIDLKMRQVEAAKMGGRVSRVARYQAQAYGLIQTLRRWLTARGIQQIEAGEDNSWAFFMLGLYYDLS